MSGNGCTKFQPERITGRGCTRKKKYAGPKQTTQRDSRTDRGNEAGVSAVLSISVHAKESVYQVTAPAVHGKGSNTKEKIRRP